MITTLIFDLDGLLTDTEPLHRQAYREALAAFGISISDAEYGRHWIREGRGIAEFLADRNLDADVEAIRLRKADRYTELVRDFARPMPGAIEILRRFQGRRRMALATASYKSAANAVLEALDMEQYFELIAAREDVARVKPSPDVFLFVADRMGVTPAECLVVEDSEKGVLAAHAAGMKCVAVPNEHTRGHDLSKASLVLGSLVDLSLELPDRLG